MSGVNWSGEQLAEWKGRQNPEVAPPKPAADQPERLIEAECTKLLEEDGWRALRTDPVSDKTRGKGFGEPGMADHLYMRPVDPQKKHGALYTGWCEVLWVEFKARGGKVKSHQTDWHVCERARGFITWIASVDFPASVQGFREHYAQSGLMRRPRWW